jgi:hypothetical protein
MLEAYMHATQYDKTWYKPWRSWALANWDMVTRMETCPRKPASFLTFVVSAIEGIYIIYLFYLCDD